MATAPVQASSAPKGAASKPGQKAFQVRRERLRIERNKLMRRVPVGQGQACTLTPQGVHFKTDMPLDADGSAHVQFDGSQR